MKWLIGVMIGSVCFAALAETLPEPDTESYFAGGLAEGRATVAGKVLKVKFNRISSMRKIQDGFAGELRSRSTPDLSGKASCFSDDPGVLVQFPVQGFGFLSKFIPEVGAVVNDSAALGNEDRWEVYVQVGESVSIALGDRYSEGEYGWSEKTVIPDITVAKNVSVAELHLFSDQVNGKTVQLEFCYADGLETGFYECTVLVFSALKHAGFDLFGMRHNSYAGGDLPVTVKFPPEGLEFFEEAMSVDNRDKSSLKAHTVYATVGVSPYGKVFVKALGRHRQGRGAGTTYTW